MINQITLVGNLGQDPELRYGKSGNPIGSFSIAYRSPMKGTNGDKKDGWMKIVCFKELAEAIAMEYHKGDRVMVAGKLDPNEWTNDNGQKIKQVQVVADIVSRVTKTNNKSQQPQPNSSANGPTPNTSDFDIPPIPF